MKQFLVVLLLMIVPGFVAPRSLEGLQGMDEPIELSTPGGTVHGTLLLPSEDGPHPVALLIAGSGPTDRDGNNPGLPGQNNSLRLLAEALSTHGVATVRYDKRGIGASLAAATREEDLRFDTYVEDAAAWVQQLRNDPRFSTVSIIGHSEGSLLGMVAANRVALNGFVSLAGAARPAPDLLREQLRPQLPPDLWEASEGILNALLRGERVEVVPPVLLSLYRPSVQPYLISWFRFDPAEEFGRLEIPALIVQGTTDLQVSVEDAHLLQTARPSAELLIVEGMNHVLKSVSSDPLEQQASYSDPLLPVVPAIVESIAGFIQSLEEGGDR